MNSAVNSFRDAAPVTQLPSICQHHVASFEVMNLSTNCVHQLSRPGNVSPGHDCSHNRWQCLTPPAVAAALEGHQGSQAIHRRAGEGLRSSESGVNTTMLSFHVRPVTVRFKIEIATALLIRLLVLLSGLQITVAAGVCIPLILNVPQHHPRQLMLINCNLSDQVICNHSGGIHHLEASLRRDLLPSCCYSSARSDSAAAGKPILDKCLLFPES